LKIALGEKETVSAILMQPLRAGACYILAHGAGAGMEHRFMEAVAEGLFVRDIATLRFQFPYVERGSKQPDRPLVAHAAIRAAVAKAVTLVPSLPLFAGGKSFGGRMSSQTQAEEALAGVHGLAFLGFPLHPAGKPSAERAKHLARIEVPMLFLQGSRDALAELHLLQKTVKTLGSKASLTVFDEADHSFHVPARSGQTDDQVLSDALDQMASWMKAPSAGRR
jgi:hypothetical protein